jgi:hypothetical protein
MIVISSSFVLGEGAFPLSHPIIGYQNLVTIGNIEATTEDTDHPATNLANPSTALRWLAASQSPEDDDYITIVTESAEDIDYLAIARHNLGSAQITVSVEGRSETEGSPEPAFDELVQETLLADDGPTIFRFTPQPLAEIRLRMQPGLALPTVAVLYVGKLLVMERSFPVDGRFTPFPHGRAVDAIDGFSQGGQFLGRIIVSQHRESTVDFEHLRPSWYRDSFDPFVRAAIERPFFFAWEPEAWPDEVGFAWIPPERTPRPEINPVTQRLDVRLDMTGVA